MVEKDHPIVAPRFRRALIVACLFIGGFAGNANAAGSVTINWLPPTENVDGTPLTTLSGYQFFAWSPGPGHYKLANIVNPGLSSYTFEDLEPGLWYFAGIAVTSTGQVSDTSYIVWEFVP